MTDKLKFYGQFDPPVDKFIFDRYFRSQISQGFFVECGSSDGVSESSCYFFEEALGWKGINIEASPILFPHLEKNRPAAINVHAALNDRGGSVKFTHVFHPLHGENFGNGSVLHSGDHMRELEQAGCTFQEFEVPALTYSDVMTRFGICNVDLFVLDVEGNELAVLDGMKNSQALPLIMCVEYGHIGIDELCEKMNELGFIFDTISHANAFFVRSDRFQTAMMILKNQEKQNSELQKSLSEQLELNEVYRLELDKITTRNKKKLNWFTFLGRGD
jgi:FkbM family methyltransferase